mmetsp:Transcript_2030/g.3496  ORF Transcript_2030/g.3496 Transcript_2030/m.3496 type:complete len:212 (-) Transcript_2030:409-1044(-)
MPGHMEKIIRRCADSVEVAKKSEIPDSVWKRCKGVAIINISEVGFVFSLAEGDGVVLKHNEDGTWGAPSCLMFTGAGGGAIFGKAHKQMMLFPMSDYALKQLTANTKFQLGAQIGLAVGPYGRESSLAADAGGKGVGATFSYVFSDGAFLNIGINDNFIDTVSEANEHFYGKAVEATDIVMEAGSVDIPEGKGVEELHAKLGEMTKEEPKE